MQLDKLSNFEVFLIILMALLMGICGAFLDKEKVIRFSLKSPILYQSSVIALLFIGLVLALAIVRSVLWDIIPNVLMFLLLLGSLWMQSYLIYGALNCKRFSEFLSLTISSLLPSLFGAIFFSVTLGDLFNFNIVDFGKNLIIYPAISTVIIFALSYLLHSAKKRTQSQSVNIDIPQIIEATEKETCDNDGQQSDLDDLSSNILSKKDNKSRPKKKRLTVKEYWDERRESGVTQAEINECIGAMSRLPQSDRNILEQSIIKSTIFESEFNEINSMHTVVLPLSKSKFISTFKDYHQFAEYVSLVNLIQELIDPYIFNRFIPPPIEDIYHIFDQDKEYIFSFSAGKKIHLIENPIPECKLFHMTSESSFALNSLQKSILRSLLRVDKKLDDSIQLEEVQVALFTRLGLYLQEGDKDGAEVYLSLQSIVNSAKSISEIEKYLD